MPSLTHLNQQSTNNVNTNKPTSTQQQAPASASLNVNQTGRAPSDETSNDPMTQALLLFEKKQRNLGKRKEKLESYEQDAKKGKELNKDQLEALAKYGEVLGQIECIKDIAEQCKKIQSETSKNQKRLQKQAAEEKRSLIQQRLKEFVQLRHLIDHRPKTLTQDENSLLDELSQLIVPTDLSSVSRSIETVLAIYHSHTTNLKMLNNRNSQDVRQTIDDLLKQFQSSALDDQTADLQSEIVKETPIIPQPPPTTPASVIQVKEQVQATQTQPDGATTPTPATFNTLPSTNPTEYPLQFDTRNQNVPLQEILRDNTFFPTDVSNQQDLNKEHGNESQQYPQTLTIVNSSINNSLASQTYQDSTLLVDEQKLDQIYEQENATSMTSNTHVSFDDQQHHSHPQPQQQQQQHADDQWQQRRTNSGNNHRAGHHNNGSRPSYRGSNNYHHQQPWRGSSRGNAHHQDGSYNQAGQRQYHDSSNPRNGHSQQRAGSNSSYRGNRGNGGQFRGGNRQNSATQNQNQ